MESFARAALEARGIDDVTTRLLFVEDIGYGSAVMRRVCHVRCVRVCVCVCVCARAMRAWSILLH